MYRDEELPIYTDLKLAPPLSLSLHPDDERCHPGPIHPSIHRQAGTTLGVIPELSRAISFFTFGQATNTDRMQDRCALPVV